MLKHAIGQSPISYYCNNTALTATSEASGSTKNGLVKSGSFKTGEEHNANLSCSKYYLCYYVYYHDLSVLSKSVKGAAMVEKFGINSL